MQDQVVVREQTLQPPPVRRPPRGHRPAHPALVTLGLGACSVVGYVAVASSQTRRRIRQVELRHGSAPQRLL